MCLKVCPNVVPFQHPAANAYQGPNKKRAEVSKIPARFVIPGSLSKPPYAALWKSSIRRIQLVSGFHLGKIWATKF